MSSAYKISFINNQSFKLISGIVSETDTTVC